MATKNRAADLRRRAEAMVTNGTQVIDEFIDALAEARRGIGNSSELYVLEQKLLDLIYGVCRLTIGLDILNKLDNGVGPAYIVAHMLEEGVDAHNFSISSSEVSNMLVRSMHKIGCSVVREYLRLSARRVEAAMGESDE